MTHRQSQSASPHEIAEPIAVGIEGLDIVLNGGLPAGRVYLVQGDPGVGKTTLGLQFLLAGQRLNQRSLYISFAETRSEIEDVARSPGWSLDGISLFEFASEDRNQPDERQTVFHSAEIELAETAEMLTSIIEKEKPDRLVIDSLSEIRILASDPYRYRRQMLALKHYFSSRDITVLLMDDRKDGIHEQGIHSIVHGVIELQQLAPEYGGERRRLRVIKMRAVHFAGGYHDLRILTGGIEVYPRLVAAEHRTEPINGQLPSGIESLDRLVGGGLDRNSSTLLLGPAGVGKSTVALQYAINAAQRGERAALYLFDESPNSVLNRSEGLGLGLREQVKSGLITMHQVDPAELTPGELASAIRKAAMENEVKVVVIDSINGYLNAMSEERFVLLHMHELLSFLGQLGIAAILVAAQHGMIGAHIDSSLDISYLADTVILFRYFEHSAEIRQAISVFKRRGGPHERTIRELRLSSERGIEIGEPLREFHGILAGTPAYHQGQ